MRLAKTLLFNGHAVKALREKSSDYWWIYLVLASIIFAIPLTLEEIATTPFELLKTVGIFLVFILITYAIAIMLGSNSTFNTYAHPLSRVVLAGSMVAVIVALLSLFLFELVLDVAVVSNLLASVMPFYLVALFAFSAEQLSLLKNGKDTLHGIISVIILAAMLFFI